MGARESHQRSSYKQAATREEANDNVLLEGESEGRTIHHQEEVVLLNRSLKKNEGRGGKALEPGGRGEGVAFTGSKTEWREDQN